MKKTTRLFLLIICMIAFGLMALGSTSSDESKDADNASAKKNVSASKTPTEVASKKTTQAETKKNDDVEVADNIERGPVDLDAVVPKKLDVIITGGHFIGDVLTAEDFTITVEMSDGSVLTNPAGWGATPLELSASSNDILVAWEGLYTTVNVKAQEKTVPTEPAPVSPSSAVTPNNSGGNTFNVFKYVINTNTGKFHKPSCSSVSDIYPQNRWDYQGTREEVINMGYEPCKRCHP